MRSILIVGDSFCAKREAWPKQLAASLGLKCTGAGFGGMNWWAVKNYLKTVPNLINEAEFVVFVHSYPSRMFNLRLLAPDYDFTSASPLSEEENAKYLYYKYVFDNNFHLWATEQWFKEVASTLSHKNLCHLHVTTTMNHATHLLPGLHVSTPLMAISQNETNHSKLLVGAEDTRANHLSIANNLALARQLSSALRDYSHKTIELDVSKFEQVTDVWFKNV